MLQLSHVDDHLALVETAVSADAMRELGLVAPGTGREIGSAEAIVRAPVSAPVAAEFLFGNRHVEAKSYRNREAKSRMPNVARFMGPVSFYSRGRAIPGREER